MTTTTARGKQQEIICACGCKQTRMVRVADIKRGWGKFFDKTCKARGIDGFVYVIKDNNTTDDYCSYHLCDDCGSRKVSDKGDLCDDCYFYANDHSFSSGALGQD